MPDSQESETSASAADAPVRKVQLDLDDAPFLQVDEPPPPPAPVEETTPEPEGPDKGKRKKIIIIAAAAAAVVIAAAVWWFFFRTPPPPPPAPPEPEVIVVPSIPANLEPGDIVQEFAPFVVPLGDNIRDASFLVCKFAAITKDPTVKQEMTRQELPLRDAIYFYLRGKDATFILDARNGEAIKKDLLSVFNDYLSQGKLEDIVFESYLSR